MRIACPSDPGLPRLPAALDGPYLAGLVQERLRALGQAGLALEALRPCYIRYKPGTSALIQVQLRLREPGGAVLHQSLAFALYRGDHASSLAARRRSRVLAAGLPAGPWPLAGYWAEPGLAAFAQGFPFDRGLPGLALALDEQALTQILAAADAGPWPPLARPQLLRHKPGRRAVLRADAGDGRNVFVKLGPEQRPALQAALAPALARRGLRVPALLAAHPAQDLVLLEGLSGHRLEMAGREQAAAGDMVALASLVLGQLLGAQGLALPAARLPGLGPWAPLAVLGRAVRGLSAILPREAAGIGRLAAGIEEALRRLPPAAPVLVHGDFYEDQILLDRRAGPALLDWDEAALGPPSLDAACWLAHARAAALEAEPAPVSAEAIQEAWLALRPAERRPLAVLSSLQLLALAVGPFRRLEPDWPLAVRRRLDQVDMALREAQAVTFPAARRPLVQSTPLPEG